jgi:restriction system protein
LKAGLCVRRIRFVMFAPDPRQHRCCQAGNPPIDLSEFPEPSLPPAFFERLVVQLLQAMGYGDSNADAGLTLGRSGDGGVDGVIKEDRLGLDLIYIQAKRYTDAAVPPAQIQAFAGALNMHRANKGVFITTSRFTDLARQAASQMQGMRIVLIDGDELTRLMLSHDVGVRREQEIVLKKIDLDFFDPDEVN